MVVARLAPSNVQSGSKKVELAATAIDMDSKPLGTQRQTLEISARPERRTQPDLHSHLALPPGRYMVRLAAESEGRTGSVFVDVEVPDFTKDPLSLSGLVLQLNPAVPVFDKAIASLIPVAPTTVREFSTADDVSVYLRVYQGGKGRVVPVRMLASVTSEGNNVTSNQDAVIELGDFGDARSADYRVTLPLVNLSPGEYLLEVEAQSGARRLKRSARFTVVSGR